MEGSRRTFLTTALLSPALVIGGPAPAQEPTVASQPAPSVPPLAPGYAFLKPPEADFAEALADHMVPADRLSPSGTAIGIPVYIDRTLGGGWGQGEGLYLGGPWAKGTPTQGYQLPLTPAQLFRVGVSAIGDALDRRGTTFAALDPAGKDAFLDGLDKGTVALSGVDGRTLFSLLYQLVVEGLFADPIYGGNRDMAGWKLVGFPGVIAAHSTDIETYKGRPYPVRYFDIAAAS